jgi:transposase
MDLFFGIDIASKSFVSFNEDQGFTTWENATQSVNLFLKRLPQGAMLAIESTGGYSKLLANRAYEAGFTVYIVQPAKVKRFREGAPDVRGKSDRIDARAIYDYVLFYKKRLHAYQPLPKFEAQLRRLARIRDALSRKLASLRTQLRGLGDSPKEIEATLAGLRRRVEVLTKQTQDLIASAADAKVLSTIPCVKTALIAAVLPALRTIPFKSKYSLDNYAGIDLKPNESGKFKGRNRMSKEGDRHLRRAVFMAGLSGTRAKVWKPYYDKLVNEKKLEKVEAINVLGRKILHTAFGVYRSQARFQPAGHKRLGTSLTEVDMQP